MKGFLYMAGVAFVLILCSCGKGSSDAPQPEVPAPKATSLIFPENNTECHEGEILSKTQSKVRFEWSASENTDRYEINLKNLDLGTSVKTSATTTSAEFTLNRGAPYAWFVISRANGTAATGSSETWKFYNQGPGVENYAPFPAEAVYPGRGSSVSGAGTLVLEWEGSDVDDDLSEYEVYFGTASDPVDLLGTTAENRLVTTVEAGTIYYWRVITRDVIGNSSQSEIFQFRVAD